MESKVNDSVRDAWLKTATPEQKIQLFEAELKTLEMHQEHNSKNPLKLDELRHKAFMTTTNDLVIQKRKSIEVLNKILKIKK
jgi:hypothetical protein